MAEARPPRITRGVIVGAVIAALLVAATVVGLSSRSMTTTEPPASVSINPTPEATSGGDDQPEPAETASVATVLLTYASESEDGVSVEASGYVEGAIEEQGTCTLVLTKGDESVEAESPAFADATTTQCGSIAVATSLLEAGDWDAVIRYSSSDFDLESEPLTVTVGR